MMFSDVLTTPQQPQFPWMAGFEFSGIIVSMPSCSNSRFKKGYTVFGAAQGAYAEQICALESELQPVPNEWNFEDAATLYFTAPTTYTALVLRANVKPGRLFSGTCAHLSYKTHV
jgi:NADPH:quinone reductase